MDGLLPWGKMEKKIGRYYPNNGNGLMSYPLSVMLRVHFIQLFYNLYNPAMENALYEIESMHRLANLQLSQSIPDETTALKFRHLLEKYKLGEALLMLINKHLSDAGVQKN